MNKETPTPKDDLPEARILPEPSYFELANGYPHNNEVEAAIRYFTNPVVKFDRLSQKHMNVLLSAGQQYIKEGTRTPAIADGVGVEVNLAKLRMLLAAHPNTNADDLERLAGQSYGGMAAALTRFCVRLISAPPQAASPSEAGAQRAKVTSGTDEG